MKFTTRTTVLDARWAVGSSDLWRMEPTSRRAAARSPPHLRKSAVDLAICVLFTACPKLSRLPTENTGPLRLAA